jgi:NADPH:quinone reductase
MIHADATGAGRSILTRTAVVRVVLLTAFGPPDVLVPVDVPEPQAGAGTVVIEVELANITFVETQIRAGRPPRPAMTPALPVVPGHGVGGVVTSVGTGVDTDVIGSRVITSTGGSGGYAERVAVAAESLIAVPDGLAMDEAVALLADGRTALLLARAAAPAPGELVLVEAAGGGLGTLLVQLARTAGARVVAAAGEDHKLALARELGAEITVNYRSATWPAEVRAELGGDVDLVFDGVGGAVGRAGFELVRDGGRFVPFGMASGEFTALTDDEAGGRGITIVRLAAPTPEEARRATQQALAEAAAGRLRPVIGQRFPLEEAARAHAAIEARTTIGKTLLVVR